jgi:putative DNA-invertase from lambdoid prophage Rac
MTVAGIYVRVSTGEQSTANQRPDLERLAAARGWSVRWYEEVGSGAKYDRPELRRVLDDARKGVVQVVAVWALDRLGRSMQDTLKLVLELDRIGVRVVSIQEGWLDTDGPVRPLLIAIFAWIAEQERERLIERTKAGLARARARGKKLGRPPTSPVLLHAATDLVRQGSSVASAARRKGISRSALRRFLLHDQSPSIV